MLGGSRFGSIKATPTFAIPYPEGTDGPKGPEQIEAAVERVEELFEQIEGLILGAPAPGNLVIVNGTSDPVYKAVTGDIGINSAGVTTIGASKVLEAMLGGESVTTAKIKALAVTAAKIAEKAVETAKLAELGVTTAKLAELAVTANKLAAECVETGKIKAQAVTTAKIALLAITEALIADGAVTSRKFKPTTNLVPATGNLALTGAFQDIPGAILEITPAIASLLKITAVFDLEVHPNGGNSKSVGTLSLDGVDQERQAILQSNGVTNLQIRGTMTQTYKLPLSAAKHTIKMRAANPLGAEACTCYEENTNFLYELCAS